MKQHTQKINVVGAGILGLWQAYKLAQDGFQVALYEKSAVPFEASSSRLAGAMLAPFCEAEASEQHLIPHAQRSLELWCQSPFSVSRNGTLIVAPPRDRAELNAFEKRTLGHQRLGVDEICQLEPVFEGRFQYALFYKDEAHLAPRLVMHALLEALRELSVEMHFGFDGQRSSADIEIDTRGMGAKGTLANLRPVRGEMAVVKINDFSLSRPVRLLHPRMPCYIVPWPEQQFMIGASVIESDDSGPVSVRSALELLGAAFAVHPGFGEAKILELSAGARPSLPDNIPKIFIDGTNIIVNGAYRHGFLLAPLLALHVSSYIKGGEREGVFFE